MRSISLLLFLLAGCIAKAQVSVYVNPFIGATTAHNEVGGLGKTFPGATTPFGLVQVSPNTITGGTLILHMGSQPNKHWGIENDHQTEHKSYAQKIR